MNQNSIQKEIKHRPGMLPIIRCRIFAIQKYRDLDTQHFACCFVWVGNMVAHIEGGMQVEGV